MSFDQLNMVESLTGLTSTYTVSRVTPSSYDENGVEVRENVDINIYVQDEDGSRIQSSGDGLSVSNDIKAFCLLGDNELRLNDSLTFNNEEYRVTEWKPRAKHGVGTARLSRANDR